MLVIYVECYLKAFLNVLRKAFLLELKISYNDENTVA